VTFAQGFVNEGRSVSDPLVLAAQDSFRSARSDGPDEAKPLPAFSFEDRIMKPIALPVALACVALLALRAAAAAPDAAADSAEARAAIASAAASSAPESPAAAFERMLAPRAPAAAPIATGTPADSLTHAFNVALWNAPAPAMHQASARIHRTGSAQ